MITMPWEKNDYSKSNNEPILTMSWPESVYIERLKLRLAMEDVLKARIDCYSTDDSRDIQDSVFADRVNEIIEGWEFELRIKLNRIDDQVKRGE